MNLYRISQDVNKNLYDTYDSAVVCAETVDDARLTHPDELDNPWNGIDRHRDWANASDVKVEFIGTASEDLLKTVVVASFNAG